MDSGQLVPDVIDDPVKRGTCAGEEFLINLYLPKLDQKEEAFCPP